MFADDLLEQANYLTYRDTGQAKQASLRRAVSTAYYARFHLLIDEAVGQWGIERQRGRLGRIFEHEKMKGVCQGVAKDFKSGSPKISVELDTIARTFIALQQNRHTADYDNSTVWSRSEVERVLQVVGAAFDAWRVIRNTDAAQDYLLSLMLSKLKERDP